MPAAHVTVHPTGQAIATTGGHRLVSGSRSRKTSPHCSSPTATPVAMPVMSRASKPVPASVSNAPRALPIATPKAVAAIHASPTLRYLRSTNHWATPISAPARAPPSAPETTPSTEPTSKKANSPPIGKPGKASIHHRKNRHPPVLCLSLPPMIPPRHAFEPGGYLTCRANPQCSPPDGSGEKEKDADQGEPDRPQDVPAHHVLRGRFKPRRLKGADEYA